jgi:hypothetical protein
MATLIVAVPGRARAWQALPRYHVLIDGRLEAALSPGDRVQINLSPGPHEVEAEFALRASEPVVVESRADETHLLVVRRDFRYKKLLALFGLVSGSVLLGMAIWVVTVALRSMTAHAGSDLFV